jgi:glycosyltransferase involved in cell wall biosynthesis
MNKTTTVDFASRYGVLFVAYFGSQTNIDALKWYVNEVHLEVLKELPDVKLFVAGEKSQTLDNSYFHNSVKFLGRVKDLPYLIANARIGISPALYGGGFRGKINQYSIMGIPTVAHSLAASGLRYPNGAIKICNSSTEWVKAVVELYSNESLNVEIANNAKEHAKRFTLSEQDSKITRIYVGKKHD